MIPACGEREYLPNTLDSISSQPQEYLNSTLVIIVLNNSENAETALIKNNAESQNYIEEYDCEFEIIYIDAFSRGKEFPVKSSGVGLARKIGFDLALSYADHSTLLCSLDADTLISSDYFKTITKYKIELAFNCIVPGIWHQKGKNELIETGIRKYEHFIFSTAEKLRKAGSPYGFITVGSAMVFTVHAYISAGGMSKRKATEDFYFLQEVVKSTSVTTIPEKLVYPSARESGRVYLGTGFRMLQVKQGLDLDSLHYSDISFEILQEWLNLGEKCWKKSIESLLLDTDEINTKLTNFLIQEGIKNKWLGLKKSAQTQIQFIRQFHRWFDGLKTHRLLKYFSRHP